MGENAGGYRYDGKAGIFATTDAGNVALGVHAGNDDSKPYDPDTIPAKETTMRKLLALPLILATGLALAGDTFRFDRGVVSVGDSLGALVQKAGRQPDRIVTLENSRGAAVGERWEYYLRDKQVNFETRGGKIVEITEIR